MISKLYGGLLVCQLLALPSLARTWTDASGRSFEATLIRAEGEKVHLNVRGLQRTFQLSQLSAKDRSFVQSGGRTTSPSSPLPKRKVVPPKRNNFPRNPQIQADVSIQVERLRADPPNRRWVYGSPNFEFICDDDLGLVSVRKFAWMFESVWQFCERLPFDVPRLRSEEKVRMKTYLIKEYADYIKLGGTPNSSGVYIPSRDIILIPFQSLDLGRRPLLKDANNTLRHEVTHQLLKGQSQQAGWFIEGLADYVATVPFDQNRLLVDRHTQAILQYITAYGWNERRGHNLGKVITLSRLESFMRPSYRQFQNQQHAYAYALALYTYFAKFDGKRDGARLANYVAALQDGRSEREARSFLLDGRSYEQLEKEMAAAWAALSLTLRFE